MPIQNGADGNSFYVKIKVNGCVADGNVTMARQIAAGNFQTSLTGPISLVVTDTLVFDQSDTKTISLHFVGLYPYPDENKVNLRVSDGQYLNAKVSCQ